MNVILVLSLQTILLFSQFNVFRAEYAVHRDALDGLKKIYSKIYMPNWIPGSYVRIVRPYNGRLASLNKLEPPMDESGDNPAENNFSTKNEEQQSRIMKLAVRQSLAMTVKKILEELLILVSQDIARTSKLSDESKGNVDISDLQFDELTERQPGDTLIRSIKSYLAGERTERAGDVQNVGHQAPGNALPVLNQYVWGRPATRWRNIEN